MESGNQHTLRALPAAHALLDAPEARALAATLSRDLVRDLVRDVLVELRDELSTGALSGDRDSLTTLALARLSRAARRAQTPRLRRVINATGVVLHTNLGRAPLGDRVLAELSEACRGYATLEYDLTAGSRGHRDAIVAPLLAKLLGADDALVVNNCAAAVLLATTALASGRDVLVSRGELVEIGGGFRIPEVIASCGARLVEVGSTNRTHLRDFERAIGPETGAILKVHQSNFAVVGFTAAVDPKALAALGRARAVPVLEDLGSGAMVDTAELGLPHERTAREALADGIDLVMTSGDKLLGGPQSGIVAGRAALVAKLRAQPLLRALRPGRLVIAALESTLRAYAEGRASRDVPAVAMLAETPAVTLARAETIASALRASSPDLDVTVIPVEGRVGGGTLPVTTLRSWAARVERGDVSRVERRLRRASAPVVARVEGSAILFDARTVRDDEVDALARSLKEAVAEGEDMDHAGAMRDESLDETE